MYIEVMIYKDKIRYNFQRWNSYLSQVLRQDVRALQVIEPKEETIIIVLLREHKI